ncbi:hypothetical protein HPG69_003391, partial [Diceros bicornis minor]
GTERIWRVTEEAETGETGDILRTVGGRLISQGEARSPRGKETESTGGEHTSGFGCLGHQHQSSKADEKEEHIQQEYRTEQDLNMKLQHEEEKAQGKELDNIIEEEKEKKLAERDRERRLDKEARKQLS